MSENIDVPVLIAGAGPVGLTAAAALDAHGIDFRIVDRAAARTTLSKALVVWARTLEVLDGLIDVKSFQDGGLRPEAAHLFADGHTVGRIDLNQVPSTYGPGVMIPQSETERILEEHMQMRGRQVDRNTTLLGFQSQGDIVECQLRDQAGQETTVRARWLVGCDGAHSAVRHGLDLPFPGQEDPNDWLLADIKIEGAISSSEVRIHWHRDGICVFFPLGNRRFRVVANRTPSRPNTSERQDPTLQEMQEIVETRAMKGLRLYEPIWLSEFFIHERKVERYRVGRIFLAGDAAHVHSPAGGQGMNTGMQDAVNLAWKLALVERGIAGEPLLESYTLERSAVGDQVLRAVSMITSVASVRNRIAQKVRNVAAELALHVPAVQKKARCRLTMLAVNYRERPLAGGEVGHVDGHGIVAGDRVPDIQLVDCHGGSVGLSSALSARRFTLVVAEQPGATDFDATVAATLRAIPAAVADEVCILAIAQSPREIDAATRVLIDGHGTAQEALGLVNHRALLVRPDRYAALHFDPSDPQPLIEWFERVR